MAAARLRITLSYDRRDLEAFKRDMTDIYLKYGDEPAPHNRARFKQECDRAEEVFMDCMDWDYKPGRSQYDR